MSIKNLVLVRDNLSADGAMSQSLWHDPITPPPPIHHIYRGAWAALGTHIVSNTIDPSTGKFYTKEYNGKYLSEENYVTVGGHSVNRQAFLQSWGGNCSHAVQRHISPVKGEGAAEITERSERETREQRTRHARLKIELELEPSHHIVMLINPDQRFYRAECAANGNVLEVAEAERSAIGEITIGKIVPPSEHDRVVNEGEEVAMWAGRYKDTPRSMAFPTPEDHTFEGTEKRLDQIRVRDFTKIISNRIDRLAPAATKWGERIDLEAGEWEVISSRCNSIFLTSVDFHLYYKHIIHRKIAARNRFNTAVYRGK